MLRGSLGVSGMLALGMMLVGPPASCGLVGEESSGRPLARGGERVPSQPLDPYNRRHAMDDKSDDNPDDTYIYTDLKDNLRGHCSLHCNRGEDPWPTSSPLGIVLAHDWGFTAASKRGGISHTTAFTTGGMFIAA